MMTKSLKEIKKIIDEGQGSSNTPFLLHTNVEYPTIADNTSNFLTEYMTNEDVYNNLIIRKRGSQLADFDDDDPLYDLYTDWYYLIESITTMHLESWARLYYALSLSYNPIWNVDGTVVIERGEHKNEMDYGQQQITNGTRSDFTTYHSVSYDSATEKETGKDEFSQGQQENTIGTHKDTNTIGAEKETQTRSGNIGVTMTQQMLNAEWEFRKKSFFETILNTVLDEVGFYYSGGVRV